MSQSVLVVDDEADLLATYERFLRRAGYRVTAAASLAAGLLALERDRPDLVILDLRLADGDGLQLVRRGRVRRVAEQGHLAEQISDRESPKKPLSFRRSSPDLNCSGVDEIGLPLSGCPLTKDHLSRLEGQSPPTCLDPAKNSNLRLHQRAARRPPDFV